MSGTANDTKHNAQPSSFWKKYPEKEELNQYWYSVDTIKAIATEVCTHTTEGSRCAFLSTPSVYYATKARRELSRELFLLDFDGKFATEGDSFVHYDFNRPDAIPVELHKSMDYVVIDPPFITSEVWEQYAHATKLLLRPTTGKILLSTIAENEDLIHRLLSCNIQRFKPSIPHLVYQYALFANYPSIQLSEPNPEVDDE